MRRNPLLFLYVTVVPNLTMTETFPIKLKFVKADWHEYMWLLLYEFDLDDSEFYKKTDIQIIQSLITTRIFNTTLYHPELENQEMGLSKEALQEGIARPFVFEKVEMTDFQFMRNLDEFKKWVTNFRVEGWEDDRTDAQIYIDRAEKIIYDRTKLKNGIWLLSKENFPDDSIKLSEIHWIYQHFESFIEIDRHAKLIRTFDFGYD